MIPADNLTPKGTDLGIAVYIDRALAGRPGARAIALYMQGPWKARRRRARDTSCRSPQPSSIAPASRPPMRIAARTYGKAFDRIEEAQRQEVMVGLATGKVTFDSGLARRGCSGRRSIRPVMERHVLRSDLLAETANKAGWRMIGFPGAIRGASRQTSRSTATRISRQFRSASRT